MSGPRRIEMDVVRDQSLVRLNTNNPLGLTRDRKVTQDRRDVSRLTQTDVSQARSRRARALSILQVAKADLRSSRAECKRLIGRRPGNLSSLAPHPMVAAQSRQLALNTNRSTQRNQSKLAFPN